MSDKGVLSTEQIEWMSKQGCSIYMTMTPKKGDPKDEGRPIVDESEIQIHSRIVNSETVKFYHSDFVPNTKGHVNKLMKEQFKLIKDELLEKRFEKESKKEDRSPPFEN